MKRAIFLLLLSSGPAFAAPLDDAIAKATAAMGGADNLHALNSLVLKGSHYEGPYKPEYAAKPSTAVMVRMQPGLRIVGCRPEIPGCTDWDRYVEGWDGTRGWELNWPKQRLIRTVYKAEQALKCGAEFLPLFVDYKARGFKATWLGPQTLLRKKTVALRIDQEGCSSATYYFDPASYEMEMSMLTIPVHARGQLRQTVAVYSEFVTVNGVRWPARSQETDLDSGEVLGGGEWTLIEGNSIKDRKVFDAPETHPVGTTALALNMLAAQQAKRGTAAIMALYDRFRATPEGRGTDAADDMRWVGFEFLKADDFADAMALFNRMIAENPQSPLFYDYLGDAYVQQGDDKAAAQAYDRALALNPKADQIKAKRAKLKG